VDVFWNFLDNRKVAARIARPFIRGVERIEGFLKANGVITRPLVPEKELFACQRHAIQILIARCANHTWGHYLEFGVFQGHSLSLMFHNLVELAFSIRCGFTGSIPLRAVQKRR
jgi:hypothetical protein